MPQQTSKHSKSWASVLTAAFHKTSETRPPGSKSSAELMKEFKMGKNKLYEILTGLRQEGRVEAVEIQEFDELRKHKVRRVYYILKNP